MDTTLARLVSRFRELHLLVVGDAMLDRYIDGPASRLSPEAPVPVVAVAGIRECAGGAANVALNAVALGAQASLLSITGADAEGAAIARLIHPAVAAGPIDAQRKTLAKTRVLAAGQVVVRFDEGDTGEASREAEAVIIEALEREWQRADAVVLSDYGYGTLTPGVISVLADLQARRPRVVAVDSKMLERFAGVRPTLVKPNYSQAMTWIAACRPSRAETVIAHSERILSATGAELAAVTLDADGVVVLQRESVPVRTHCQRGKPAWAVGAGDTYVTAFALALAAGASAAQGAELAAAAASLVVDSPGTEACAATALLRRLDAQASRLTDESELRALVGRVRAAGGRVVFTNGVFDILHSGHIAYLSAARALGDLLVVGLNTDASVKRLKGPSRPVNHLEARAAVLDGLSAVNALVAFSETTPERLIRMIQPDIFVKGGDYTRESLPEAAAVERFGGEVVILPYADGYSTTSIIERATSAASLPRHSRRPRERTGELR